MIKFFRRFRQKLLSDNKFGRYLLYAIGEIILVVIGILIALQINNWNEGRKSLAKEHAIVNELYLEINKNIEYTKSHIKSWSIRKESTSLLLDTLRTKEIVLKEKFFDSLFTFVLSFTAYEPVNSKFKNILSANEYQLSVSKNLTDKMLELDILYKQLNTFYQYNIDTWKDITQPYLIANYSFRKFSSLFGEIKIRDDFNIDHKTLINDPVFDNILENIRGDIVPFYKRLELSLEKNKELITIIENDYPQLLER